MNDVEKILAKCKQMLGELAGAASVCWDDEGVFESTQAQKFVEEYFQKIKPLIEDRERLIAALERTSHTKHAPGHCHTCDALAQSEQTTREIIGGGD